MIFSLLKINTNPHLLHRFYHIGFFRGQLSKNNCVHVVVSIVLYLLFLFVKISVKDIFSTEDKYKTSSVALVLPHWVFLGTIFQK